MRNRAGRLLRSWGSFACADYYGSVDGSLADVQRRAARDSLIYDPRMRHSHELAR